MKKEIVTENYAIYQNDVMNVITGMASESIDLSIYSPPFAGLYNYSSDIEDFSNCETKEQFLDQYEYLIKEIARTTKPGRISAVHVTEVINQNGSNWDFPNEVVKLHQKYGFHYKNRITIWKEPLKVRMRTMVRSLMHKFIVEDSTECFTAMPDYILIFKKKGVNETPVTHPYGLFRYAGDTPILPNILNAWNNANGTTVTTQQLWNDLNIKYRDWKDAKSNKLSHYIWQRYASAVWDDIRIDNIIKNELSKEDKEDGEKHMHPLQLDVIDRLVDLYSNENEVVFTPFMGVGSEVYSAVSMKRKAIGAELKEAYFSQAVTNMETVNSRFKDEDQLNLFS